MLKHYINIFDNIYYIEQDGVIIFSIKLNGNQLEIRNENGVYGGTPNKLILNNKDN